MSTRERTGALLGFAVLAAYVALHWFALVADPPLWRCAACLAIAVGAAVVFDALGASGRGWPLRAAAAAAIAAAALATALIATGTPARLLVPGGWSELRGQLDTGLTGISQLELPYEGKAAWTRLGILLAAPVVVTLAGAIAFWPARTAATLRRGVALVLLVGLYAVAVTWESPGAELAHGFGLLACVAAFLWLGRFPAGRTLAAAAAVVAAGLIALPAAARVSTTDPAINYANWTLFGAERTASFDWDHSYGPLDWPQRGTELFEVRGAESPQYWKTSVLNEFDGVRWTRGDGVAISGANPELDDLEGVSEQIVATEEQWLEEVEVSILGLRSPLLVTTGITRGVDGVEVGPVADDGTTLVAGPGLEGGDSYTVSAYVPNPSAKLLKRRDDLPYPPGLARYTTLLLPIGIGLPGVPPEAAPAAPLASVTTPLRGVPREERGNVGPRPARLVADTPYERVHALARRLTRDAPGNYQAVVRVERYLLRNFRYEQEVPERRDPLPAFLLRDQAGYCQHFSGAMALLLRLAGIPSRVVSGFAPGRPEADERTFLVRDTDAHSWVEVWFPEVGWVTVDPTPAAAPARTEAGPTANGTGDEIRRGLAAAFDIRETGRPGEFSDASASSDDEGGISARGFLSLAVLATGVALGAGYRRRRRRLLAPGGADAQLRELERALPLVGGRPGPRVTLMAMERQLISLGTEAAAYPAGLRANRYRAGRPRRPGPRERRALRRAIGRALGIGGRLRALRAIPPGGPRR
jgi:transglutaminase-like putative cysteine protease